MADKPTTQGPRRRRPVLTTGGSNGRNLGRPEGPRGHYLEGPVNRHDGMGWRVGCQCNWMTSGHRSETVALDAHAEHLEGVRPAPTPRKKPRPWPEPRPSALQPGTVVQGSLASTIPGWKLLRADGAPLVVAPVGARPARLTGQLRTWELIEKVDGRWTVRLATPSRLP